jgi:hypothetical protein
MYLYAYVLYIMLLQEFVCAYVFNCMQLEKLCGIAQLDVGFVTVCYVDRTIRVIWRSMAHHGRTGMLQLTCIFVGFNTRSILVG